ncbi:hypothetical protein B0E46_03745 [Rhodanobacter sp. B04]|uniref:hypothetical protein n=1 Tax=Rhodanobacter sp. B04 TaxID=1945860 RepID=UPI000985A42F|nr:hypothetical protein [Rhodanobacter sp. B04]OOG65467.1 hypothetical protein B0E46_03745 [Rhodanobacter sp. B04]
MSGLRGYVQALRDLLLHAYTRRVLEVEERTAERRMRLSPAEMVSLVAYLAALLVSHLGLPHVQSGLTRVLVALLPLPPIVLIVLLSVRRVLALDELQRRIELVALAVVAVSTWLGCVTCWLLQHAGMAMPSLSLGFLAMGVLYGVARRWAQRHYA